MKKFDEFCKKHKIINPLPVDQRLLCYYNTYLAQQGLADSTIRVYLSALRHHHIAYDIPEPDRTKVPKLKLVDSGIRRTKTKTPKQIRLPVTPDILRQVYKHWYSSRHDYETIMLWSTSTLCFFGFFRLGELLSPINTKYDASSHLSFEDVAVDSHSSPSLVKINPPKNLKNRPGAKRGRCICGQNWRHSVPCVRLASLSGCQRCFTWPPLPVTGWITPDKRLLYSEVQSGLDRYRP